MRDHERLHETIVNNFCKAHHNIMYENMYAQWLNYARTTILFQELRELHTNLMGLSLWVWHFVTGRGFYMQLDDVSHP